MEHKWEGTESGMSAPQAGASRVRKKGKMMSICNGLG